MNKFRNRIILILKKSKNYIFKTPLDWIQIYRNNIQYLEDFYLQVNDIDKPTKI